jgi:hypothetical protein
VLARKELLDPKVNLGLLDLLGLLGLLGLKVRKAKPAQPRRWVTYPARSATTIQR